MSRVSNTVLFETLGYVLGLQPDVPRTMTTIKLFSYIVFELCPFLCFSEGDKPADSFCV